MGDPDIRFYHLTRRGLTAALAALLDKALSADRRAVVRAEPGADLSALSRALWSGPPGSFLAHGHAGDPPTARFAADQPIWLTTGGDNPASADVLFLLPGADGAGDGGFALICHLFEGGDHAGVTAARAAWSAARAAGHDPTYWQETEAGGWARKGARGS
ncbi:MAG TPA: DNA polymerase III subunit chi [Rhodospirillaceae bacterium]|jgi:DNA polymerase-3 subunit chi|nr:DNA polymerase III subunit chi [Alphaproteobacteria bacterium]HBH26184.1 DNA polymerase III subunit chi [Rhodospirillaceae bacterium]